MEGILKKLFLIVFVTVFLLSGCAPSEEAIQRAIAQTQASLPTSTQIPTQKPTTTPAPSSTPEETIEELRIEFTNLMIKIVKEDENVESVNLVRGNNGVLEIEVMGVWASKDRQPNVNYQLTKTLAFYLLSSENTTENILSGLAGGDSLFSIAITTISSGQDYRYYSI